MSYVTENLPLTIQSQVLLARPVHLSQRLTSCGFHEVTMLRLVFLPADIDFLQKEIWK